MHGNIEQREHARDRNGTHGRDIPAAQQGAEGREQEAGRGKGKVPRSSMPANAGERFPADHGKTRDDDRRTGSSPCRQFFLEQQRCKREPAERSA